MDDEELEEPCASCDRDCDGWDARFCCTRCTWGMDEVPENWCEGCDPWDI